MADNTVTESSFRIGLARAFYAKRQSNGKYDTPVEFEFPEECDIKINGGDAQSIYAGDASRWRKAGATSKELSVQMTHFKRSFLQDCLGFVAESTTGGITDTGSGKAADFAEKYLHKGTKIAVSGHIQTGSYTDRNGQKVYTTQVIVEEQEFVESKGAAQNNAPADGNNGGFKDIPDGIEENLPFS